MHIEDATRSSKEIMENIIFNFEKLPKNRGFETDKNAKNYSYGLGNSAGEPSNDIWVEGDKPAVVSTPFKTHILRFMVNVCARHLIQYESDKPHFDGEKEDGVNIVASDHWQKHMSPNSFVDYVRKHLNHFKSELMIEGILSEGNESEAERFTLLVAKHFIRKVVFPHSTVYGIKC